jgi:spoIIIJ-associated protein
MVAYRVREQRQGIVRGRQRIVIEVDPAAPRSTAAAAVPAVRSAPQPAALAPASRPEERAAPARRPSPAESRPPRVETPRISPQDLASLPRATGPEAEAVSVALQYLASLAGVRIDGRVVQAGDGLHVDLGGEGRAKLVAEDASLLEALEQLLPRAVRGLHGSPVALSIDSGGVREQILEDLRRLAIDAAERVRSSGQPETLSEMNPAERRIVHLALAENPDVATESLGTGTIKRIQIRPR